MSTQADNHFYREANSTDAEMRRAVINSTALVAEFPQWQPMDKAPKDGTELIGYRADQGVFVFRWAEQVEFVPKDAAGDPIENYDEDFAWWWHDRWGWMEDDLTPTLWMPLPAEPR